jgi:hypothetical protein
MIIPKSFVNGTNLTNAAATYYTVPASTRAIVKKATFCNDDAIAVTVTINLVPSGGAAAYGNCITKAKVLAAGETWSCPDVENHVMEASGFISMVASVTAKIGTRISGFEVTM